MTAPLIHARDLRVGYAEDAVCAPVSFDVRPGQALALVGLNGTGKTTILRAVLGLLEPKGGKLTVLGAPVDERSPAFRRAVASVLDVDAYYPALSALEHIYLLARAHGVPNPASSARQLLADFDLAERESYLPAALSSGQRRRLLLCSAFIRPCQVLVLDEPEQRLDTAMRLDLARRLNDYRKQGVALLFATHDPALLTAVATQAVLLGDHESPRMSPSKAAAELTGPAA